MTKFLAPLCACLALAAIAAGCGSSSNKSSSSGGGGATSTTKQKQPAKAGGGTAAKTITVSLKNIAFNPSNVTVPVGGTVKWVNDDSVGHDVTKQGGPGPNFKSGSAGGLSNGATFSETFKTAGTIKYRCTIHPGMTGTVTVK